MRERLSIPLLTAQEIDRFRAKVTITDGCHPWTGYRNPLGYGRVNLRARPRLASRVAYFIAHGVDPGEFVVRHKCDNPPCVNPAHLVLGTQKDNVLDAIERGQHDTRGSRSPVHRLGRGRFNEDLVREVRRLLSAGMSQTLIATLFGATVPQIHNIKAGKKWSWVI
jgi:hypothetical protein